MADKSQQSALTLRGFRDVGIVTDTGYTERAAEGLVPILQTEKEEDGGITTMALDRGTARGNGACLESTSCKIQAALGYGYDQASWPASSTFSCPWRMIARVHCTTNKISTIMRAILMATMGA